MLTTSYTEDPTDPADLPVSFLTVDDVRAHLNLDDDGPEDELELAQVAAAACGAVEDLIGPVALRSITEPGIDSTIVLTHRPVHQIVEVNLGGTALDPSGYYLDGAAGLLYLLSGGSSTVLVTYLAGRAKVPPHVRLAALEMVRHLWQFSQNGGGLRFGGQADEAMFVGPGYAVPNRVRELIAREMLPPVVL